MPTAGLMPITVRFHDKEMADFAALVENVGGALDDMTLVWKQLVPLVESDIRANFNSQGTEDGTWGALTPEYQARKQKLGLDPRILIATGWMMGAATRKGASGNVCEITKTRFVFGVEVSGGFNWPLMHDKYGVGKARTVREFMVLRLSTIEALRHIITRHIDQATRRK